MAVAFSASSWANKEKDKNVNSSKSNLCCINIIVAKISKVRNLGMLDYALTRFSPSWIGNFRWVYFFVNLNSDVSNWKTKFENYKKNTQRESPSGD